MHLGRGAKRKIFVEKRARLLTRKMKLARSLIEQHPARNNRRSNRSTGYIEKEDACANSEEKTLFPPAFHLLSRAVVALQIPRLRPRTRPQLGRLGGKGAVSTPTADGRLFAILRPMSRRSHGHVFAGFVTGRNVRYILEIPLACARDPPVRGEGGGPGDHSQLPRTWLPTLARDRGAKTRTLTVKAGRGVWISPHSLTIVVFWSAEG